MTLTPLTSSTTPITHGPDKATTLALRLAHAENALLALTAGQADAIVDPSGKTYLLRPAQEHLRDNEARLRAVIESAADVITLVNRGGKILSQSPAVSRVLGYEPGALVGTSFFDAIHPGDLSRVYSAFFNVIEGFAEHGMALFRHRKPNGAFQLIEATMSKLRDAVPPIAVLSLRPVSLPLSG